MVKLDTHPRLSPKHRCTARKATSTEAARDDPEPKQTKLSTAETPEENCHHPLGTYAYIFLLLSLAVREKLFAVCSLAHFRADARPFRHTEPDNAKPLSHTQSHQPKPQKYSSVLPEQVGPIVENFAICMSNSPFKIPWFLSHREQRQEKEVPSRH